MARGSQVKEEITKKILEVFKDSFLYNNGKEIRVPMYENGEEVQVKITLTAAKDNVQVGQDNALPEKKESQVEEIKVEKVPVELTQEEKDNIANLLKSIGL